MKWSCGPRWARWRRCCAMSCGPATSWLSASAPGRPPPCTCPPPPAAWPAPGAGCSASCHRTRLWTPSAAAGQLSCRPTRATSPNSSRPPGAAAWSRATSVGGEVLSPSLARAACQTLGVPQVDDSYSMTEVIPVTARTCSHRHLHHDVNIGLTELLDLQTGEPAAPGALGTMVITPYFPYRDCAPVFRYDTRDVARCLPDEAPGCELAGMPATSQILGKADHLLQLGAADAVTPRQLIDAVEALPTAPWPARYRATAHDGRIQLTLPAAAISGYGEAAARRHFADAGLDVELAIVSNDRATSLRHTRSDLRETTFASQPALVGA